MKMFIFAVLLFNLFSFIKMKRAEDYCQLETFRPSCTHSNEVVLITTATYGRMEVGKCISQEEVSDSNGRDPKYFGCSSDVTDILHGNCSLKKSCEVKIPDASLDRTKPCFPSLKMYLKVEYKCINVVDHDNTCQILASSIPKYLTIQGLINITNCGGVTRPWILEASRGQKIRTTFISMKNNINANGALSQTNCGFEIGSFVQGTRDGIINKTLCSRGFFHQKVLGSINDRRENMFISNGSVMKLNINTGIKEFILNDKDFDSLILVKIEAEGCLDVIPPEDTWLKRTGDDIVIGCYSSKQTWYLRCENKKWSGTIGNCSAIQKISPTKSKLGYKTENPGAKEFMEKDHQILFIIAICGVGVVFCSVIICIGAVCLKRLKISNNLIDKHPIQYQDVQYSMKGQTILKHQYSMNDREGKQAEEMVENILATQMRNKENNYFVLEQN